MPEFSDDDIRRIYRDYIDSGDSISVIGRRHGIDKTTLHRRFKGLDLPRRTRQGEMPKTAVPDPDPITVELASDRRQTIGYDLMRGLLLLLPEDARWTTAERDKHLAAYVAVLDLVTEVVE